MATTKYQGFPTYRYAQIALKGSKNSNQNTQYIDPNPAAPEESETTIRDSDTGREEEMRSRGAVDRGIVDYGRARQQQQQQQQKQQHHSQHQHLQQHPPRSVSSKEELEVDFENDVTELYQAISNSQWNNALETLKTKPHEARTWVVRYKEDDTKGIMWRFLPIHSACARQPPKAVMASLIQAYAKGAESCDDQGMYPLHYASGNQASADVIWQLIQAFPHAATISDPNGMLPIHYMAQWGPSETKAIDALLFASQQTNVKDDEGNTPLHYAEEGDYPFRQEMIAALKRGPISNAPKKKSLPSLPPVSRRNLNPTPTPAKTVSVPTNSASASSISKLDDASSHVSNLPMKVVYKQSSDSTVNTMGNNTTSLPPSTHKTVNRLTAQINKLKADFQFHGAEYEEELTTQREEHEKNMEDLNTKILKAIDDNANVRNDLESKVKYGEYVQGRIAEVEKDVNHFQDQNDRLEKDVSRQAEELRMEKSKAETHQMKIKTLSSRINLMLEDQRNILSSLASIESDMKVASEKRRKKLQELFDEETRYINELSARKQVYGPGGPTISGALNQQRSMMENCALVLRECEDN